MRERFLSVLCVALLMVFFAGCAAQAPAPTPFDAYDLGAKVKTGQYAPKVDNFMVILDGSHSMIEAYKGQKKFNQAWNLAYRLNQTIPDMPLVGALRTFGATPCPVRKNTTLVYGATKYSRQGFEDGLNAAGGAGGVSPLNLALNAAVSDLNLTQGPIALIIFSDFKDMEAAVIQSVENLKSQFSGRICIYPVLIGNDPAGKSLQEKMVQTVGCGFAALGDEIYANGDMANFVESVFFEKAVDSDGDGVTDNLDQCPNTRRGVAVDAKGCPLDSDGDGVTDDLDQCPNTRRGVAVDAKGCPLDSDGDGVTDDLDQCPNTPRGVAVDAKGCPLDSDGDGVTDDLDQCPNTLRGVAVDAKGCPLDSDGDGVLDAADQCPGTPRCATVNEVGCWVVKGVMFDVNKANIKSESTANLNQVVNCIRQYPNIAVEIQGHTDSQGSAVYNQTLSQKRADAVMQYFVNQGIAKERLKAVGYGASKPAASNDTKEGRAQNRRVQIKAIY